MNQVHQPDPPSDPAQARREELRERILALAEAAVAEGGLAALRARDLAAGAGCAVGTIYTIFEDLGGVILAVNARTFRRLGAFVHDRLDAASTPPADRLVKIGEAYLDFAMANTASWQALFEMRATEGARIPDWYREDLAALFAIIGAPLAEACPEAPPNRRDEVTRTLFSAVHGIVTLGLERRMSGVPSERLRAMVGLAIRGIVAEARRG